MPYIPIVETRGYTATTGKFVYETALRFDVDVLMLIYEANAGAVPYFSTFSDGEKLLAEKRPFVQLDKGRAQDYKIPLSMK